MPPPTSFKPLAEFLPPPGGSSESGELLGRFLDCTQERQLSLYPAQEEAILEWFDGKNVILGTPTGSGKSLVAAAVHFQSLARGERSVYTCPIKALVNEKWLALCREFGPSNVGLSTGDATVNRKAPILCCTAEILANMALREGANTDFRDVIMDEFHYYSDKSRGIAWQAPLLILSRSRFLLMSATLGDTTFFEQELTRLNRCPTVSICSGLRPVPLDYEYAETTLAVTLENLLAAGRGPVYVVHFTQGDAAESAQDFMSLNVASREAKASIAQALEGVKFNSPFGPDVKRWLRHGIGIHHAGILPKYRLLVEKMAQQGLLQVICGTDTLGVGINVPIRTVLMTRLCKFDGEKTGILSARDFHQIAGRAGRKGFDDCGWVVVQAPEHAVENLKLEAKSARDGKKIVRRKAPDKNFVHWDKNTFTRLLKSAPERLISRFQVSHGMLLNVLSRGEGGCEAMRDLIRRSHETPAAKRAQTKRAWQLFRSLLERRIVEIAASPAAGHGVRVNVELQEWFSMDQTLSLYLIETLSLVDPASPTYALDVVTLAESILEDPELILRRQLDRLKSEKLAQLKAEGVDYLERMDELEKLEYPKPLREFVYSTFNAFADRHPWVGQENIRPKSVVREMLEQIRSFQDYVKDYELQRAEGLLLRHVSAVHKVLRQTVPEAAKTDALREIEVFLGLLIRQVDSSLIDEWERMRDPSQSPAERPEANLPGSAPAGGPPDFIQDQKAFSAAIRARLFLFLRALAGGDCEAALGGLLDHESASESASMAASAVAELRRSLDGYRAGHTRISLDPEARNARYTFVKVTEDRSAWKVEQILVDPEGLNDWVAVFEVSLAESRLQAMPAMRFLALRAV